MNNKLVFNLMKNSTLFSTFSFLQRRLFQGMALVFFIISSAQGQITVWVNGENKSNYSFPVGTEVLVSITSTLPQPTIFYTLDGSRPNASSTEYRGVFPVTGNVTVRAVAYGNDFSSAESGPVTITFQSTVTLDVKLYGGGKVERTPDSETYNIGQQVSLRAVPDPYYSFSRWENGSTDPVRVVTLDRPMVVTATFTSTVPLEEHAYFVSRRSYGGNLTDAALHILPDGSDFILFGLSASPQGGDRMAPNLGRADLWAVKMTSDLRKVWDRAFGTAEADLPSSFIPRRGGGYWAAGYNYKDAVIVSFDSNGQQLVRRTFNSPTAEEFYTHIASDGASGYLLGISLASEVSPTRNIWLLQLDGEGQKISESSFDLGNEGTRVTRLIPYGNRFLLGTDSVYTAGANVSLIDAKGNFTWSKNVTRFVLDIVILPDNSIGVLHTTFTEHRFMVLNSSGAIVWDKLLPNFEGYRARVVEGKGIYILGIQKFSQTAKGVRLLLLDYDGNIMGDNLFSKAMPQTAYDFWAKPPNSIILAGSTSEWNRGESDLWAANVGVEMLPKGTPRITVNGDHTLSHSISNRLSVPVELKSSIPNAVLRYNLDGSSNFDRDYTGPFELSQSARIRAAAFLDNDVVYPSREIVVEMIPNYQLTVTKTIGGTIQTNPFAPYYASNSVVKLTAIPSAGWKFLYWTGDVSLASAELNLVMDKNKSVHAVFGAPLTTSVTGSGRIHRYPDLPMYPGGTVVQLLAIPNPGYFFALWGQDRSGTSNYLSVPIQTPNLKVGALFQPVEAGEVALTALPNGNGTIEMTPSKKTFTAGETVNLRAVAGNESAFLGWTGGDVSSLPEITIQIHENMVIYANFTGGDPALLGLVPEIKFTALEKVNANTLRAQITGREGATYTIQTSEDLNGWAFFKSVTIQGGIGTFEIPTSAQHQFFRVMQ